MYIYIIWVCGQQALSYHSQFLVFVGHNVDLEITFLKDKWCCLLKSGSLFVIFQCLCLNMDNRTTWIIFCKQLALYLTWWLTQRVKVSLSYPVFSEGPVHRRRISCSVVHSPAHHHWDGLTLIINWEAREDQGPVWGTWERTLVRRAEWS